MAFYHILILGCRDRATHGRFEAVLHDLIEESGLAREDVEIATSASGYPGAWDPRHPMVIACFSHPDNEELAVVEALAARRVPIIPVATKGERFRAFRRCCSPSTGCNWRTTQTNGSRRQRPYSTASVCCGSNDASSSATAEPNLAMLRSSCTMRLRREGSTSSSTLIQFAPARSFRTTSGSAYANSDVVVMLDTETYFESKWTREEFGRAQASGIFILQLVWPSHTPSPPMNLAESRALVDGDLVGGLLADAVIEEVGRRVERLRARGLAARFTEITGKLSEEVRSIGARIVGTGG